MGHGIPHPALGPPTMTRQLRPQSCLQHAMACKVEGLLHQPLMAVLWCGFPDGHLLSAPPVSRAMCGDEVSVGDTRSEVWMYTRTCTATEACMNTSSNLRYRHGLLISSNRRHFPPFPLYLSNPKHKKVPLTLRTSACSLCALHALGGEKIPLLLSFVVGVSRMPSFLFSSEVGLALLPIVVIAISSRYTGSTTLTVSYEGTCRGHLEEKHPGSCFYEVAFSDISVPFR